MEALSITSLSFSYPNHRLILDEINWNLEQGSFTLLVGATGNGKTTLLRCIKPELAPTGHRTGNIEIFSEDLETFSTLKSAQCIAYVGQDPDSQIVCDSVWHELAFGMENIGMDQNMMRRRVAEVAHFFGMESWIHQSTSPLSGGQKQLVSLASVLALQPKIILLDEPTAQLDPVAEKNFLHALFRINRELGITIIVATHTPYEMRDYATSAFVLNTGRLHAINTDSSTLFAWEQTSFTPQKNPVTDRTPCIKEKHELNLREVYFSYGRDSQTVLRNMSLNIQKGCIHALVGGNGCGKSTLLRVLAGALRSQHGKVSNPYTQHQALLPQNPKALFVCDSLDEELREWQEINGYSDERITSVANMLKLENLLDHHPYDLSGGEQQLAAFAKILLTEPHLLLLDEPTKGLDALSKNILTEQFLAFKNKGGTIIIATHDLGLVKRIADTVSLLFDGEVACTEPTDQFLKNTLFYRFEMPSEAKPVNR